MSEDRLKDYFCPTCKRKVFRGSFTGEVQIKCQGCKSLLSYTKRICEVLSSEDKIKT